MPTQTATYDVKTTCLYCGTTEETTVTAPTGAILDEIAKHVQRVGKRHMHSTSGGLSIAWTPAPGSAEKAPAVANKKAMKPAKS